MERNFKIIEFYGLPGCGKTTLRNKLLLSSSIRAGSIQDVMALYKQESFFYRLFHLPIKQWWLLSMFLITLPQKRKNAKTAYVTLFYKVLSYSYCAAKSSFDIVVVDHGLVQQLGTILHNMDYNISEKSLRRFVKFASDMKGVKIICCYITSELSLSRMRSRNRNGGRIDAVMNDTKKAIYFLDKERVLFERFSKAFNNNDSVLDMSKTPDVLSEEVFNMMRNKS